MLRPLALAAVLLALAAAPAHAAGKAARPHAEPAPVAADALTPLARSRHALVELDRTRGSEAAAQLQRNGGRLISAAQQLWLVPGPAAWTPVSTRRIPSSWAGRRRPR